VNSFRLSYNYDGRVYYFLRVRVLEPTFQPRLHYLLLLAYRLLVDRQSI
jgi:hypothetical protein